VFIPPSGRRHAPVWPVATPARNTDPVPRPIVLLLPPSEGKAPGGKGRWATDDGRFPELAKARHEVAAALVDAMDDEAGATRVTSLRGPAAAGARATNRAVVGGPVLPAWQRYTGVVWDHLDPATLKGAPRRRAASILVVSAIGGLFAFDDPIPDYKCGIGNRLPGVGGLAPFWRRHSAPALVAACSGAIVWDLLPSAHRSAIALEGAGADRVLRVEPRTEAGRAVGHDAKAVKGAFARWILETGAGATRPAALATFTWPGWRAARAGDTVALIPA
jgi:cytoplasmic iron level regulating protein YaaA (DUF328/UPF0246 family)